MDAEACTGCARCVKRCPFKAIAVVRGERRVAIDPEKCFGCGVCRSACEQSALQLHERRGAPDGLLVSS